MKPSLVTQQDKIEVKSESKLIVIRQDRLSAEYEKIHIQSGDSSWRVMDYSPFGVAVFSKNQINVDEISASFVVQNVDLGLLDLKRVRSEETFFEETSGYKTGFVVNGYPISLERTKAVIDTNKVLAEHAEIFKDQGVPEDFRLITYEIKNWLAQLEGSVNQLEKDSFEQSNHITSMYEDVVAGIVASYIQENIYPLYVKLERIVQTLDSKTVKKCFQFFRDSCGQFLFQSAYANRAYKKPRGYAGDFEMMKSIYNYEHRGSTLFGRCIERYFIDVPESQAVRNRGRYLCGKIKNTITGRQRHQKIMSVACGPAMEVQYLFSENPELVHEDLEFHFVDQDTEALKECQKKIEFLVREKKIKAKVLFHNWAIKNIIESGLPMQEFDLIYTAGLFDYLSGPVAQFAAKQLYSSLSKVGELIIGNFDISAPNRFGMSLVTDWHLIYRSSDDLKSLFSNIGKLEMEREELGINLFASIRKTAA